MTRGDAIRRAYAALQAGQFAVARDASAGWRTDPAGALLHALGTAGAGDVAGGAAALAAIARANPAARHPALDLADLLRAGGRTPDIAAHLRAAVDHAPADAALLGALGAVLTETGPMAEAIDCFRRATHAAPGAAATWSNLGKALAAEARFDEAEAAFGEATRLAPRDAQLGLNHAIARLKSGRLAAGWPLFRSRTALPGRAPALPGPELTATDGVRGRTVLLVHDEGFGDTLQFIRYAPLLTALGARVLATVPPPLVRLLSAQGIAVVTGALPAYDAWCRLPDLPGVFGTTLETIPPPLPYREVDPLLTVHWAARLPPRRKVGLVWAGAARTHDPAAAATDRLRSIPAAELGTLLATTGVRWISLQHGQAAPPGLVDPMPAVTDFADTAAIIASLDLVVSVDTAVAHLAAGMGCPVILMDRYDNCWRWLSGRTDSPWYPGTIRIIRQSGPGCWRGVLRDVGLAVSALGKEVA